MYPIQPYPYNDDIKRFCEIQNRINELHGILTKEYNQFYDGGYSFEECNYSIFEELVMLEEEFLIIIKRLK